MHLPYTNTTLCGFRSNLVLNKIVVDCGILLGESDGELDANIDLIKDKELAQATLAEAEKKDQTQQYENSVEVEEISEEINEDHERLLHELEDIKEVGEQNCAAKAKSLEVCDKGLKVKPKNKPK